MGCTKCKKKKKGKEEESLLPEDEKISIKNLYNSPRKKKMVKSILLNLVIMTCLIIYLIYKLK